MAIILLKNTIYDHTKSNNTKYGMATYTKEIGMIK